MFKNTIGKSTLVASAAALVLALTLVASQACLCRFGRLLRIEQIRALQVDAAVVVSKSQQVRLRAVRHRPDGRTMLARRPDRDPALQIPSPGGSVLAGTDQRVIRLPRQAGHPANVPASQNHLPVGRQIP